MRGLLRLRRNVQAFRSLFMGILVVVVFGPHVVHGWSSTSRLVVLSGGKRIAHTQLGRIAHTQLGRSGLDLNVVITTTTTTRLTRLFETASRADVFPGEHDIKKTEDVNENGEEDAGTIAQWTVPWTGQEITLIGTAHLSQKSNQQVQRLMQSIQPQVVMVELDPSRLHRIGIDSIESIAVPNVVTADDIALPPDMENIFPPMKGPLALVLKPLFVVQEAISEAISRMLRVLLTGMYQDMSDKMDNPKGGGAEFLVAIREAERLYQQDPSTFQTVVLGDRSSLITIKRAAMLAFQSGDPLGVLRRLQEANALEMRQLEERVRNQLQQQQNANSSNDDDDNEVEDVDVHVVMMETMKQDEAFRKRLFRTLEQQVPEFTQAFLKERDYIMAESIRRQLMIRSDDGPITVQRLVGVVGLAHVPGIMTNLQDMMAQSLVPLHHHAEDNDEDEELRKT